MALDELLSLPGIGAYTARAVLAFAGEHDVGVVDTNIGRVLARVGGSRLAPSPAQKFADELVPTGRGWVWNQALMELGALVCRPTPTCTICPIAADCRWRGIGPDPAKGSAAVSRGQSTFAGSDRQGRGQLVAALRAGPVATGDLAAVMGWSDDQDRASRVASGVVADGLAVVSESGLRLP